jgi:GT2 family glycosyltransferase
MVDVVIPTFRAWDLVRRCVGSLNDPEVGRIFVVDDASGDGAVEKLRRHPRIEVVTVPEPKGLAHAFNRGAEAGDAEYVLFLNNDAFARQGAVSALVRALEEDPEALWAGGRLVDVGTDRTQYVYRPRRVPGALSLIAGLLGASRLRTRRVWTEGRRALVSGDGSARATDDHLAGACVLVRRGAFEAIGGWDERFWFWYEDVDLSRRLGKLGHAVYVPKAVFEHVGAATWKGWARHERHRRLYHGTIHYGEAHFSRAQRAWLGLALVAVSVPRMMASAVVRPEAVAVYRQVIRGGLALLRGHPAPSFMRSAR